MRKNMTLSSYKIGSLILLISFISISHVYAHEAYSKSPQTQVIPSSVSLLGDLPPPPPGVTDIKFRDFFKMPIGKRGLELNEKFLGLDGKRIRIIGYMAKAENPVPGMFVLSALPVELGDEDESLSDDLPANSVFVHTGSNQFLVHYITGLIKLTGTLSIGSQAEADGHVSMARLLLDPEITSELEKEVKSINASK